MAVNRYFRNTMNPVPGLLMLLGLGFFAGHVYSRTILQIVPTLTISEEYRSNFLSTGADTREEFITTYALGFSAGWLSKKQSLYLSYSPEYRDYKNFNGRDRISHIISLDGEFHPTRFTSLIAGIHYDGDSDDHEGESRNHTASLSGTTQMSKNTVLTYSHSYSDQFNRQARTGDYQAHILNTSRAGIDHRYGKRDHLRVAFLYEFDEYDTRDNADAYTRYEPTGYLSYWFNPDNGMDANVSYQMREFDDTGEQTQTISGDIRYIRPLSKHFEWYLKYRHSYSDTDEYTHHVFHPSVGFDWDVTEDAGISLGAGPLFHDWSNDNDESVRLFLDINAYKNWDFSRRGSLAFTGASGYSDAGDEASSLGYTVYYQAGAQLNYQLFRRVSSSVFGSFRLNEYREAQVDRKDENLLLGAGLDWQPLEWLVLSLNYTYTDFNSNTAEREGYEDHRAFVSIRFIPERPVRMNRGPSRQSLETTLYQRER